MEAQAAVECVIVDEQSAKTRSATSQEFQSLLPADSIIASLSTVAHAPAQFKAVVRAKIDDMEGIKNWKDAFSSTVGCRFIAADSKPRGSMKKMLCSKQYLCAHSAKNKLSSPNSAARRLRGNNTKCQASIRVQIKAPNVEGRRRSDRDKFAEKGYLGVVSINWVHNHSLMSEDALSSIESENPVRFPRDERETSLEPAYDITPQPEAMDFTPTPPTRTRLSELLTLADDLMAVFEDMVSRIVGRFEDTTSEEDLAQIEQSMITFIARARAVRTPEQFSHFLATVGCDM